MQKTLPPGGGRVGFPVARRASPKRGRSRLPATPVVAAIVVAIWPVIVAISVPRIVIMAVTRIIVMPAIDAISRVIVAVAVITVIDVDRLGRDGFRRNARWCRWCGLYRCEQRGGDKRQSGNDSFDHMCLA